MGGRATYPKARTCRVRAMKREKTTTISLPY